MSDALALSVEILAATATVAAVTGFTAWRFDAALKRRADSDSLFWIAFSGFLAVLAICLAAVPAGVGAGAALAAVAGTAGAGAWVVARERTRAAARRAAADASWHGSLEARHDAAVRRWASYELDPALALEYPAMTAGTGAESRLLIAAMRDAMHLRRAAKADPSVRSEHRGVSPVDEYATSVLRLEQALLAAEAAAGVAPRRAGSHSAGG